MIEQVLCVIYVFDDIPHIITIYLYEDRGEFLESVGNLPQSGDGKKQASNNYDPSDDAKDDVDPSQRVIIILKAELNLILDLFCFQMKGVDIVIELVILPDIQSILWEFFSSSVQRDGTLVDLEEDGELIQSLLLAIGSEVGGHNLVVWWVIGMLVEVAVVEQRLKVTRLIILDEVVRVGDYNETFLPRVAWLNVLDVVLSIEHEGGLLVA